MFDELDMVVLTHAIKEYGLKKGDLGTIVHLYGDEKAMEVEFVAASGKTIAVLTLIHKDIRPMAKNEILHVRGFATI
ncbi:MAG: DUF4926 domain-containing protein [Candidatus Levybacteria bacterium]|nr:DUF4926 domain-containing protein [Candidatus Levybacteria bacterium]